MKINNKKAFFSNPLIDIFVYLAFVMLVIFVVSLLQFTGTIERNVTSKFIDVDIEKTMLSYLRKPIYIENHQITVSELFLFYYISKNPEEKEKFKEIIEKDLKNIFSSMGKGFCWSIVFPRDNDINKEERISLCNFEGNKETTINKPSIIKFFLPGIKEPLKIQLGYSDFKNRIYIENYI